MVNFTNNVYYVIKYKGLYFQSATTYGRNKNNILRMRNLSFSSDISKAYEFYGYKVAEEWLKGIKMLMYGKGFSISKIEQKIQITTSEQENYEE